MKLKTGDINSIIAENSPKPRHLVAAEDYNAETAKNRDDFITSLTSYESQATARHGEILPPRPRSLHSDSVIGDNLGLEPDALSSPVAMTPSDLWDSDGEDPDKPRALRGMELSKIASRADLIKGLYKNLPLNELSLPKFIYRPDVLDWQAFSREPYDYEGMQNYLDGAYVELTYIEGFPALPNGSPLWKRMPFETQDEYNAFTEYCTLPGMREIQKLNRPQGAETLPLEWFHNNYWALRTKCFDMMRTVYAAKQREQRIMSAEDDHYLLAEGLLNQLKKIENEVDWSQLKAEPDKYVSVLEKIVKLQRLTLGLSTMGAGNQARELRSETIEMTMRQVARPEALLLSDKTEGRGGAHTGNPASSSSGAINIRKLLKDPSALGAAQELVIRMTRATETNQQPDDRGETP